MIELVVVITILGILGAMAMPRFINISNQAKDASLQGVAGAMASAMQVNLAACTLLDHVETAGKCAKVAACGDVSKIMHGGAIPPGFTVDTATLTTTATDGETANCTVRSSDTSVTPVTFVGISAGNR